MEQFFTGVPIKPASLENRKIKNHMPMNLNRFQAPPPLHLSRKAEKTVYTDPR